MSQLVTFQLTETGQQLLLQIARNAVHAYLSGKAPRPGKRLPEFWQSRAGSSFRFIKASNFMKL